MIKDDISTQVLQALQSSEFKGYIQKVSLFGSYIDGTATPNSDVDLLITFSDPISFFELARLEQEFQAYLQKKVDIVTPDALSKYIYDDVMHSAQTLYEA